MKNQKAPNGIGVYFGKLALIGAPLIVLTSVSVGPRPANADGTIFINGRVASATCMINAGADRDYSIVMPTVKQSDFSTAGSFLKEKEFSISLTQCDAGLASARAFFSHPKNIDAEGFVKNTVFSGTPATGVAFALFDGSTRLNLAESTAALQGATQVAIGATNRRATLTYSVKYVQTAATVGLGDVKGVVDYRVMYD